MLPLGPCAQSITWCGVNPTLYFAQARMPSNSIRTSSIFLWRWFPRKISTSPMISKTIQWSRVHIYVRLCSSTPKKKELFIRPLNSWSSILETVSKPTRRYGFWWPNSTVRRVSSIKAYWLWSDSWNTTGRIPFSCTIGPDTCSNSWPSDKL